MFWRAWMPIRRRVRRDLTAKRVRGRLSRFKAAGSLLNQSLDPCTELLDPVAPLGL